MHKESQVGVQSNSEKPCQYPQYYQRKLQDYGGNYSSYFGEERDLIERFESLQSSNLTTLSPQKQNILMEQGKSRILESQPRSSIGDPIQSNIEVLKKQRYGRPNTNSPFPYMQKRDGKVKQSALPSTAATSHLNQLMAINEDTSPTSNVKDINQTINSQQLLNDPSGLTYETYISQKVEQDFRTNYNGIQESLDKQSNVGFQAQFSYARDEKAVPAHKKQCSSNERVHNLKYVSEAKPHFQPAFIGKQQINPELIPINQQFQSQPKGFQGSFIHDLKSQRRLSKRKVQTEPNSPKFSLNDTSHFGGGVIHSNRGQLSNHQIVVGREMPIRQSINKGPKNNPAAKGVKFSSYADEPLSGMNLTKNKTTEFTSFTTNTYEDRSSSFLPKLEVNHRYSNSQVQYREDPQRAEEASFISDILEKNLKSPRHAQWNSNDISHDTGKKGTFSHDKRISQQVSNKKAQEFARIFQNYPGAKTLTKPGKTTKFSESKYSRIDQDFTQQGDNIKDFSELYSIRKGIGKFQPVAEIKTQLNEQVIRGKIYRDKIQISETPQKLEIQMHLSNQASQQNPLNELMSPTNQQTVGLFNSNRPIKVESRKKQHAFPSFHVNSPEPSENANNVRILNVSELSEDFMTQQTHPGQLLSQSYFHQRNYSISQGASKQEIHGFQNQVPQFNTIEEVIKQSKDQFIRSGQINLNLQEDVLESKTTPRYRIQSEQKEPTLALDQSSEISGAKPFHHTIKTVASKQMPKCFRMSKHQIQLINRHNHGKGINTNPHSQNRLLQLEGNPSKYEYTFLVSKNGHQASYRSNSNDARVSFNDPSSVQFAAIAKAKAEMNQAERRDSKKAELNMYNVKIELNNEQVERERMTPAFNARQSYVYKKEE